MHVHYTHMSVCIHIPINASTHIQTNACCFTISNAPVRVGYGYRVEYYFIYFPVAVQHTGKRVVLQVDGSVEVCRVTISRYLNAPVRVGSSYRVGYYFIYFLVALQNTGKRVVLEVDGRVEVCRVTISRYL